MGERVSKDGILNGSPHLEEGHNWYQTASQRTNLTWQSVSFAFYIPQREIVKIRHLFVFAVFALLSACNTNVTDYEIIKVINHH